MNIVFMTTPSALYAAYVLRDIISSGEHNVQIFLSSKTGKREAGPIQTIIKTIKVSGVEYLLIKTLNLASFKINSIIGKFLHPNDFSKRNYFTAQQLASGYRVPVDYVSDVNSEEFLNRLSAMKPDFVVSVYFNQIFNSSFLKIPKSATLNIHPALLPNYRGSSPVFWAMANNEKKAGITIHLIDTGIDTGAILDQFAYSLKKGDSFNAVSMLLAKQASKMLSKIISNFNTYKNRARKQPKEGSFYRTPTKQAHKKLKSFGYKLF